MLPAMFSVAFPALNKLNILHLHSPQSAITSAIVFNALIIVALIPLALRGVPYRPASATSLLRRNLLIYGVGGLIIPFAGSSSSTSSSSSSQDSGDLLMNRLPGIVRQHIAALRLLLVFTVLTGIIYPVVMWGIAQAAFNKQANGSMGTFHRRVVSSSPL